MSSLMQPAGRVALLALLVAVPALGPAAFLAFDRGKQGPSQRATVSPGTKADLLTAVWDGDVLNAFVIARSGPSPHAPVPFRNDITGGVDLFLTPFLLAAARDDQNMVLMLLTHTQAPDHRSRTMATCLVLARGDHRLAGVISPDLPADACPDATGVLDLLQRYSLELQQTLDPPA